MVETVFLVLGDSESGDHYQAVFKKKPTKAQLSKLAHRWDGSDERDGPGYDGSWVHIEVIEEQLL